MEAEMEGKKLEKVGVSLSEAAKHFVTVRFAQLGFESGPAYIRHLVDKDMQQAIHDFNLLEEALKPKNSPRTLSTRND